LFLMVCVMIFLIGSRGPLFAALLYSFILFFIDRKSRLNILLISSLVVFIVVVLNSFISDLLTFSDVSSRTLNLILEGDISNDSNRFGIYSLIWNGILESPVWGHGIYGDRIILGGDYSHNFFLEFIYNFGIYFGFLLIFIFSYIFGNLFSKSNTESRKLLMLFFCYCFIPLLFSRSYLNDPNFGILIGAVFSLPKQL
jgi:hypothetical protein